MNMLLIVDGVPEASYIVGSRLMGREKHPQAPTFGMVATKGDDPSAWLKSMRRYSSPDGQPIDASLNRHREVN